MRPGTSLVLAALGWFLLGAVGFFSDFAALIWLFSGLTLLPLVIADGIILYFFADRLFINRVVSSTLAQDQSTSVKIEVRRVGKGFLPFKIALWDIHPSSIETETQNAFGGGLGGKTFPAVLDRKLLVRCSKNDEPLFFEYSALPRSRGEWVFKGTELLLFSLCRFWRLKVFHSCESIGRTYPNFKKIKAQAGTDLRGLLERSGLKNIRLRGAGTEFESLRDYREGDSIRAVDWRATSRKGKVIVREYQEERDQQVLFLLDSGYRLHRMDDSGADSRTQFDSALEAVLLLSWVSLKHGDSAAVGTFGASNRWLNPRKGISSFPLLMNALYDAASAPVPSSPLSALEEALSRLKRRTFIVLISNFREEDGQSLSWILRQIEKRHLLLLVSLKEKESDMLAGRNPAGSEEALETAAAFSYLASRRELYAGWEHSGLLTLECSAGELSSALINRYVQVKRSGRL